MKVIAGSQLPIRLPMTSTLVWYLLLDKLNAPAWIWGAMGVIMGLLWCVAIVAVAKRCYAARC